MKLKKISHNYYVIELPGRGEICVHDEDGTVLIEIQRSDEILAECEADI